MKSKKANCINKTFPLITVKGQGETKDKIGVVMARLVEWEKWVKACMLVAYDVMIAIAKEKDSEAAKQEEEWIKQEKLNSLANKQ